MRVEELEEFWWGQYIQCGGGEESVPKAEGEVLTDEQKLERCVEGVAKRDVEGEPWPYRLCTAQSQRAAPPRFHSQPTK